MPKLETLVWAQEEPKNNGAWFFVEDLLEQCLTEAGMRACGAVYAGRACGGIAGDGPCQAPRGGAGGLDCGGARP